MAKLFSMSGQAGPVGASRHMVRSVSALINDALRRAKQAQRSQFRDVSETLLELHEGRLCDIMARYYSVAYPQTAPHWNKKVHGVAVGHRSLNILADLTRQLSVVFDVPPEAYLVDQRGERLPPDHPEARQWVLDARDLKLNRTLKRLDEMVVLLRSMVIQPSWIGGRMRWVLRYPHRTHVLQSQIEPSELISDAMVSFAMPQALDTAARVAPVLYQSWTVDSMYLHEESGRPLANPLFPDNVNHYAPALQAAGLPGFPCVVVRDSEPGDGEFWPWARESWLELQLGLNGKVTDLDYVSAFQSAGIAILSGYDGTSGDIDLSPGSVVVLESEGKLTFVQPNANFTSMQENIENCMRRAIVVEGGPANQYSGAGTVRNLGALKFERARLDERRDTYRPIMIEALADAFEIHKAISNHHAQRNEANARPRATYSDTTELRIVPGRHRETHDIGQQANARSINADLGITSPVAEIMTEQGVSRDEALEIHSRNLAESEESRIGNLRWWRHATQSEVPEDLTKLKTPPDSQNDENR